jgi:hypothetical protein
MNEILCQCVSEAENKSFGDAPRVVFPHTKETFTYEYESAMLAIVSTILAADAFFFLFLIVIGT